MPRITARSLSLRLAALGLSAFISLLLAEGILRVFQFAPSAGIRTVDANEFDRIPGIFKAGQRLIDRQKPALPFHVEINDLGYRGKPIPRSCPPGETRILMVGDSFTYGDFVDDHETLPAQVGVLLRESGGDFRVINAGVGGSTVVTHTEMVVRALDLGLAAVVLTFSENDVFDLASPLWNSLAANREMKSRFPLSIIYPALSHTALWNFTLKLRARLAVQRRPEITTAVEGSTSENREEQGRVRARLRAIYAQKLKELRDDLAEVDIPLSFVIYPSHHSVAASGTPEQLTWAAETAESLGIPTLSLLDGLRAVEQPIEELYLIPEDGHPGPNGYAVAAKQIVSKLVWHKVAQDPYRP